MPPRRRETCLPFACYCGLRLSDVYALRWKDIVQDGEQYRMSTVMQKTTTPIYLPLSRHAVRWLPERNGAEDGLHVFAGLPAEPNINKVLAKWMATAGINKKSPITRAATRSPQ